MSAHDDDVAATEAETIAAGRALAARLAPGTTVLLYGDLGAGKTAFVRGLAEGLGHRSGRGQLPHLYDRAGISRPAAHAAARGPLSSLPAEVADLALDDLLDDATIMAIEWAERLPRAPARRPLVDA